MIKSDAGGCAPAHMPVTAVERADPCVLAPFPRRAGACSLGRLHNRRLPTLIVASVRRRPRPSPGEPEPPSHSGDDRPSRVLAGLLVAAALVGLVVCLVADDIA